MSRRKWLIPGCALLVVLLVGVVVVAAPAALALRLAGFRARGSTADYLEKHAVASRPTVQWPAPGGEGGAGAADTTAPAATPAVGDGAASPAEDLPQPLGAVRVDVWFLSEPTTFYTDQIFAERLERGLAENGQIAYFIEFGEDGANTCLEDWFGEFVAQEARLRDPWIDLKPGGAVVYADVDLEVGWQQVGAVFMLDASGRQLVLAGVDIDGRLYSAPPAGEIADLVNQLESEGNRALRELTFLDPAGELTIQAISLSEDSALAVAY